MIKILIHGIKDGIHVIRQEIPVSEIEGICKEFIGNIYIDGKLRKLGNRYSITGRAECTAKLVCDRTLKEFEENIVADIKISFLADDSLFHSNADLEAARAENIIIREDNKYIDITQEVREQLAVMLPLKRLAPEFADVEFEQLFPQYSNKHYSDIQSKEIDERWAPLKKIKFN